MTTPAILSIKTTCGDPVYGVDKEKLARALAVHGAELRGWLPYELDGAPPPFSFVEPGSTEPAKVCSDKWWVPIACDPARLDAVADSVEQADCLTTVTVWVRRWISKPEAFAGAGTEA